MNEYKSSGKNRALFIIIAVLIAAVAVLSIIIVKGRKPKETIADKAISAVSDAVQGEHTVTELDIRGKIENASELTTLKYLYHSADIYESSKKIKGVKIPLTTDMVVFSYDGIINIGFDLKAIDIDVDSDKKEIDVVLPEPKILSHELDEKSFEFRDAKNSILNDTSLGDYSQLMSTQKEKEEKRFMENEEYLKTVTANARTIFKDLIGMIDGTDGYTVIFE
ncbi:MAG: DUF4230 domain-containing protein [Ruminococcus sp.]|nr:DUF4230 domain-containing protein [Ruminococcus sp.]